jgi:hypothetical protein
MRQVLVLGKERRSHLPWQLTFGGDHERPSAIYFYQIRGNGQKEFYF